MNWRNEWKTMNEERLNTDVEIWRGPPDENGDTFYSPSIHVTEKGRIGINVGGTVLVKSVEDWHAAARRCNELEVQLAETEDSVVKAIGLHQTVVAERDKWQKLNGQMLQDQHKLEGKLLKLEAERNELKEIIGTGTTVAMSRDYFDTLRADNAALREALEKALPYMEEIEQANLVGDEGCHWPVEFVRAALAATPESSLAKYQRLTDAARNLLNDKDNEDLWQPLAEALATTPADSLREYKEWGYRVGGKANRRRAND